MSLLSAVYGRAATLRRNWYQRHPDKRRRLDRAVISIGNLVMGGSGKTPVAAAIALMLRQAGERPAILSRGYGRRVSGAGVVIVSDGARVLVPVERSGDEPQMLARQLPDVPVIVSANRYAAGQVASDRFGATVLLLDDGFQHLQLERDIDLLIASAADLRERVLPAGRLREELTAARAAHAVLVPGTADDAALVSARLGISRMFTVTPRYEAPRLVSPFGAPLPEPGDRRVVAVAGIARPERFFDALRAARWEVLQTLVFGDHHWFSDRDLDRVATAARQTGAALVITTEKDAVRVAGRSAHLSWAYLPMRVSIDPATFPVWLAERLAAVRLTHGARWPAGLTGHEASDQ